MDRDARLKTLLLAVLFLSLWLLHEQRKSVEVGNSRVVSFEEVTVVEGNNVPQVCKIADWNHVETREVPHHREFRKWADGKFGAQTNLLDAESRLLSAFVYHDQISVVTTAQHTYGRNVSCLYFDCNRNEIPSSEFPSFVAPMTTVGCARRKGAEFVSLRFNDADEPEEPIPLTFRVYREPVHELSVCVGPLYGNESKWLEVVEFVEHYRLLGSSYFYFALFGVNEYDRKIIDDYERLGLAESTSYVTEYIRVGWQFHLIQTHECHHRSRFHSKWVINVDIDERLVYTGPSDLVHYLRSMPVYISEVSFSTNRVLKTDQLPDKYTNRTSLRSEMMFLKYKKTTENSWYNLKGIVRPELVALLFYHWAYRPLNGTNVMAVPKRFGHIRHYRSTEKNALNGNWQNNYEGVLRETRLDEVFERKLVEAVERRVKYVYEQRMIRCEEIPSRFFQVFAQNILDCKYKNETTI